MINKKKRYTREKNSEKFMVVGKVSHKYGLENRILRYGIRGSAGSAISYKGYLNMIILENEDGNTFHIQVDDIIYNNEYEIRNDFYVGEKVELIVIKYPKKKNLMLYDVIKRF